MPENTLAVRLQLRYDTLSNWMNSSTILMAGEAAVASFPASHTIAGSDATPENTPPAIGIKIGDGYHYFDELPWVQAVAGDVYAWAKTSTKPTYGADEIDGLITFIEQHSGGSSGGSSASTGYRIVFNSSTKKYTLQYFDDTTQDWVNTTSVIDLSGVFSRLTAIENWANGATTGIGVIELPIAMLIRDEIMVQFNRLNVNDQAVQHQFVTAVEETNGKITVYRAPIAASDITSGVLPLERGGIGIDYVEQNEVLVGNGFNPLTTKPITTTFGDEENASIPTVGAVRNYVVARTAGLTGAMHFIGEATVEISNGSRVDPRIENYNFANAQLGDVILGSNYAEYVWTGSLWRLLGDEGSYAIKGSIVNADISDEAAIDQSKIDGLSSALDNKVDKVEGKVLSSNDFSDEYKDKLDGIDAGAQENAIEHIFLNDTELVPGVVEGQSKSVNIVMREYTDEEANKLNGIEEGAQENLIEHIFINGTEQIPTTIERKPKSVAIDFVPFTQAEKDKLENIEAGAQVNSIESIYINEVEQTPNEQGELHITIDQAALNLDVITGARVPGQQPNTYEDVDITSATKQLSLARVAKTGLAEDLLQGNNTYITLYCGTSTDVI